MIGLDIQDNVSKALRKYGDVFGGNALADVMLKVGQAVGIAAESVVSPYPAQANKPLAVFYTRQRKDGSTYKSKFKSLRQQRFVMRLAVEGKIPYRRTGLLGRSITSEARNASANGVDVFIGSNAKHARRVIGKPPFQYFPHQNVWTPLETDITRNLTTIANAANAAALKEINARLK